MSDDCRPGIRVQQARNIPSHPSPAGPSLGIAQSLETEPFTCVSISAGRELLLANKQACDYGNDRNIALLQTLFNSSQKLKNNITIRTLSSSNIGPGPTTMVLSDRSTFREALCDEGKQLGIVLRRAWIMLTEYAHLVTCTHRGECIVLARRLNKSEEIESAAEGIPQARSRRGERCGNMSWKHQGGSSAREFEDDPRVTSGYV